MYSLEVIWGRRNLKIKLNLENDGLGITFKDYEIIMLRRFWEDGGEHGSGKIHEHVNKKLKEYERSISRASVIFRLNWLVDLGVLDYRDATGKGGYHRIYRAAMTEEEFWRSIAKELTTKLCAASGLDPSELFQL